MKRITYCFFVLALAFIIAHAAQAQVLYGLVGDGPDSPSDLYIIDTDTGAAAFVGPTGFERCGGMDFDVQTERLIAACQRNDGSDIGVLVEINPLTGQGTEIGPLGCDTSTDISFRHSDNTLFGALSDDELMGFCPNFGLANINADTGNTSFLGALQPRIGCCGYGMAFSLSDTLFLGEDVALYTVNQSDGSLTQLLNLTYLPPADNIPRTNAMDLNPATGVMFASVVEGGGQLGGRTNFLATVNLNSGVVTVIGETQTGLDAIAFVGDVDLTRPIPALSEIGLITAALVLFAAAIFALRRRQRAYQS